MVNENHLRHIVDEIEYHLTGIAKEIDPQKIPKDGISIDDEFISFKYIREKTAAIKSHIEWLRYEMEDEE